MLLGILGALNSACIMSLTGKTTAILTSNESWTEKTNKAGKERLGRRK